AEDVMPWINLVPKRLPDQRDSERQFLPRRIQHVLELDEDRLRGFRSEIGRALFIFGGADESLEHEVERARLCKIFATTVRTLLLFAELVGPQPRFAGPAIDH